MCDFIDITLLYNLKEKMSYAVLDLFQFTKILGLFERNIKLLVIWWK